MSGTGQSATGEEPAEQGIADVAACGDCRYYAPTGQVGAGPPVSPDGTCHRHAPQASQNGWAWPPVNEDDWCGDYQPE